MDAKPIAVRQTLMFATGLPQQPLWNPTWMKGFTLSTTLQARSGFPFDVTTVDRAIGYGFANSNRPNLVSTMSLWSTSSVQPGNQRLNPQAFR